MRRSLRVLSHLLFWPLILLALVGVAVLLPPVQDLLRTKAVAFLKERTGAEIRIAHLALRYPVGVTLEGLYVEDVNKDTLLYMGSIQARLSVPDLFAKRISLHDIRVEQLRASVLQFADSTFNFDHIVSAFAGTDTTQAPADTTGGWDFAIEDVGLDDVRFALDLSPSDLQLDLAMDRLMITIDRFAPGEQQYHINEMALAGTRVAMRTTSGPPSPDPYPMLENPLGDLDIRFGRIGLEEILFAMKTTDSGDSLWVGTRYAEVIADSIDLRRQRLVLDRLALTDPQLGILTATRDTNVHATTTPPWLDQQDGFRYFVRDRDISIAELDVRNGSFAMHTGAITAPDSVLDPRHLVLKKIDVELKDVIADNDRVAFDNITMGAAIGAGGPRIFTAFRMNLTPELFTLNNSSIDLDGIRIGLSAEVRPTGLDALYRAPWRVPFNISLSSEMDLSELVPTLYEFGISIPVRDTHHEKLSMQMAATGTMERLDTLGVRIEGDRGSEVNAHGRIANANDVARAEFDLTVERITMGPSIHDLARSFAPRGTPLPGRFTMSGHGIGAAGTLRAEIEMASDLGDVDGSVGVTGWTSDIPDGFEVDLALRRLNASRLTGDTAIGPVSARVTGRGSALNTTERQATLSLTPTVLSYRGTDLTALRSVIEVMHDSVRLDLTAKADPIDLSVDAAGKWPGKGDSLTGTVDIMIETLHMEDLGLMDRELNITGRLIGRASFDPEGSGRFELNADGLTIANATRNFRTEHFNAIGAFLKDSTAFDIDSDALTLMYHTNVPIDSLVPRTQDKITSIFTADTAFTATPGKHMALEVTLPRTEWLTGLLIPELEAIRLERFIGRYDSDKDLTDLRIDLPYLAYDSIEVFDLSTTVTAEGSALDGTLNVARIERDSLYLSGLSIGATTSAGVLTTTLHVEPADEPVQYHIGIELRNEEHTRTLHLQDELVLNARTWRPDPRNILRFHTDGWNAEHLSINSGAERAELITEAHTLRLELEAFQITTITGIVSSTDSVALVEGVIDGRSSVPRTTSPEVSADMKITDLRALGTTLGDLHFTAEQPGPETYAATVALRNATNRLDADVEIRTGSETRMQVIADLDLADVGFLKPFLSDVLYDLKGGLGGRVEYAQQGDQVTLDGGLDLKGTAIGVIMTGATYTMQDDHIALDDTGIHFNDLDILDSLGNTFRVDGDIGLKTLSDPALDLRVRTEKFQMVNSNIRQNDLFFGDLFASTDLRITGTAGSPLMKGSIGILPGTLFSVVLPGSKVELIKADGIVVFTDRINSTDTIVVRTDGEVLQDSLMAQLPGIELDLSITIDKEAQFAVVLDPTTGDQATFSGSGELAFRYAPDGDMYLSGPFVIDNGGYTLEFYGLVKKRFDLVKGSKVTWSGDPLEASMDITARYISNSAPYPLVASATSGIIESERNRLQQPIPFEVLISIDGSIDKPRIDLGLDLARDLRNSFPQVSDRLDQLRQPGNDEDRNRQVFGLLVLNSFIQDEGSGGAPSSGIASSAARSSVNGLLTEQMNKLTGRFVKGVNISLGVNTYDQASGGSTYQRTSLDYKVSKRVLDDRLSFEVGGSVGVDEQNSQVSNVSNTRAAQYAILYDLTEDGRFRLRGFHENAYDLYDGEITNSGIAIMFTKDFEENERARAKARGRSKRDAGGKRNEFDDEE
ncbi:MAG: translocation/assembly module TamB domain-containing protein [Flavobacteriales bacterium]|nr:translocation/assembly module TamB domain-containing protein [Flavobacteriales bacterium]